MDTPNQVAVSCMPPVLSHALAHDGLVGFRLALQYSGRGLCYCRGHCISEAPPTTPNVRPTYRVTHPASVVCSDGRSWSVLVIHESIEDRVQLKVSGVIRVSGHGEERPSQKASATR